MVARLTPVTQDPADLAEHYDPAELEALEPGRQGEPVVSVEHVGSEPVQCIEVGHPDHLYVTDGFLATHNTNNIIFLKSTDDTMIQTLSDMSGTRHVAYNDSKTVTKDTKSVLKSVSTEGKYSITVSTKEEPVLSKNDFFLLPPRNSIVYCAGETPIWNRNETIMPMAFSLHKKQINRPGKKYSLQTIPTMSSAMEFDLDNNQPDFRKMLEARLNQAAFAERAKVEYERAYGYTEYDIQRLDSDVYADEVMSLIHRQMQVTQRSTQRDLEAADDDHDMSLDMDIDELAAQSLGDVGYDSVEVDRSGDIDASSDIQRQVEEARSASNYDPVKRYAGRQISRAEMFSGPGGNLLTDFASTEIIESYKASRAYFERDANFVVEDNGTLRGHTGEDFIVHRTGSDAQDEADLELLDQASQEPGKRVYSEGVEVEEPGDRSIWDVRPAFLRYLVTLEHWQDIAEGQFEKQMAKRWSEALSQDS